MNFFRYGKFHIGAKYPLLKSELGQVGCLGTGGLSSQGEEVLRSEQRPGRYPAPYRCDAYLMPVTAIDP